ncbi:hypothetical protein ES319_D09G044200v1 [Gossypium barbadense]|nr:hypothetical protein ES319_D09G044200v1 [Gossypium barbadense]
MEELSKKERELEVENKQLKSQLELEHCFQSAQGLGDCSIEMGNEYTMIPSQANHAQQQSSTHTGYHQFIPQKRVTEDRTVNRSGANKCTAGWL